MRSASSRSDGTAFLNVKAMVESSPNENARSMTGRFVWFGSGALRRFLLLGRLGRRTGVLALGGGVALDELDHRHRRGVTEAETRLQDAQVAAVALGVARPQRGEELVGDVGIAQEADRLAAGVQAALLA